MLVRTSEVDLIEKRRGEREIRLYLVIERGEWLLPRSIFLLEEKLNAYASFVLDGKMREMVPYLDPRKVRIVVQSHGQAPASAAPLLEKVSEALRAEGPSVTFERIEDAG